MTYPPQPGQPGQDPYGQQPGQFGGQPGQYGQQPGQFGQQPPPYGPQPTAQFGQPPTGYDGGFGGYPPGGPPGPPPKKSNTGVIAAVAVGAVLVLGGAGTGIYFLTKGDDKPSNSASTSQSSTKQKSLPTGSLPKGSSKSSTADETPTETSGGGGGGGGGDTGSDAEIVEVAKKYAKAVTDKDEAGAKAATCNNDAGILYDSGGKVEVTGKPEKFDDSSATIDVEVTIGTEKIPGFPLFLDKKANGWCVT